MPKEVLDSLDKQILYLLDIDARIPDSKIASKVGLSKPAVKYRINRLLSRGIIKKFQLSTNPALLGLEHFKVYIQLENTDVATEDEIIKYLTRDPNAFWVVTCRGRWDIIASFYAKSALEFGNVLRKFLNKFDANILERIVCAVGQSPIFNRSYFWPGDKRVELSYGGTLKKMKLDETDYKILDVLSQNSRESLVNIAKGAGVTPETVRTRMRNMEKGGLILGYRLTLDVEKINYETYLIAFKFRNLDAKAWKDIVSFAKFSDNIIYMPRIMGDHDADFEVEVRDSKELDELLNTFRNRFSSVIRGFETTQITKEHKIEFFALGRD